MLGLAATLSHTAIVWLIAFGGMYFNLGFIIMMMRIPILHGLQPVTFTAPGAPEHPYCAIVWLIAFGGMYFSQKFTAEAAEPWLQLVSAFIILGHRLTYRAFNGDDERRHHGL
jgi:ABC-type nickel/cobalt efflux system permease component RcnA